MWAFCGQDPPPRGHLHSCACKRTHIGITYVCKHNSPTHPRAGRNDRMRNTERRAAQDNGVLANGNDTNTHHDHGDEVSGRRRLINELRGFAEGSTSARASLMRDAADALEESEVQEDGLRNDIGNLEREKADAWDEGFDAGEQDYASHRTFDEPCIPNPYRAGAR